MITKVTIKKYTDRPSGQIKWTAQVNEGALPICVVVGGTRLEVFEKVEKFCKHYDEKSGE